MQTHTQDPFVFEGNVTKELKNLWSWPIQQVISILSPDGRIKMSISIKEQCRLLWTVELVNTTNKIKENMNAVVQKIGKQSSIWIRNIFIRFI